MEDTVQLLSPATNFAVVHLPGRKFPGVVVQGDTLNEYVHNLKRMAQLLNKGDFEALADELSLVEESLLNALRHYEHVCTERGIHLPYFESGTR